MPIWQRSIIVAVVVLGGLCFVLPLWWSLVWASWHTSEIFSFPPKFLPGPYLFENLAILEQRVGIWRVFLNSVLVTTLSLLGSTFFCSLTGFAFAKYRFRLRNALFYVLLATMAVPGQITAIPLFLLMLKMHWVDTYQAIILPGIVPAFGVFLMRMSAEESIPDELLEAARMDGANELRIFFQIALPLLLPSVAALAIFGFAGSWGSLYWPMIVLRSTEMFTLPVAMSSIIGTLDQPYHLTLAGSFLATIPPLLVFFATQRFFVKSMVAGAFR
jgi:lactose/L-arabinose transport system permease protein